MEGKVVHMINYKFKTARLENGMVLLPEGSIIVCIRSDRFPTRDPNRSVIRKYVDYLEPE